MMPNKKQRYLLIGIALVLGAIWGIHTINSAYPRYGEVLLSYEMTVAGDAVEIQLERGDVYDTVHFLELEPMWEGSPFPKVVSEYSYWLKRAGADGHSPKERDKDGIYGVTLDKTIEGPSLSDGLHILYSFMPRHSEYATKRAIEGYLCAGITTDPTLAADTRTVQIYRLDSAFYVYFWTDYSYAEHYDVK